MHNAVGGQKSKRVLWANSVVREFSSGVLPTYQLPKDFFIKVLNYSKNTETETPTFAANLR